jgi:ATP-dependent helicase IRC3
MPVELRQYQKDCCNTMLRWYQRHRSAAIAVPTGGGKTIIFTKYAHHLGFKKTLALSHRDELVEQTIEKASLFYQPNDLGVIKEGIWQTDKKLISASIQTLVARPQDTNDLKNIDFIIYDEAHHAPADTYREALDIVLHNNPDAKLLGASATPFRIDDKALDDIFEKIIYSITIGKLQSMGYLVDIKTDYHKIKSTNKEERMKELYDIWKKKAEGRKTVVFLSTIEASKAFAKIAEANGTSSAHIDGAFTTKKRREIISRYRKGKINILSNVGILTEGYDDPAVECIVIDKQTDSMNGLIQMIGRGLRPSIITGKKDCLLIDTAGNPRIENIAGLEDMFYDIKKRVNATELLTRVNRKNIIINCGYNDKFIDIKKLSTGGYDVYVIDIDSLRWIEAQRNLPYEIAVSVAGDMWLKHKEEQIDRNLVDVYRYQEPTSKQKIMIEKFRHYYSGDCLENITRFDAINLITYGIYRTRQYKALVDTKDSYAI